MMTASQQQKSATKHCNYLKSELYLELVGPLNSGEVVLLDNKRLRSQLANLERKTRSGGKDSVDHAPGTHDDVANVVAGALATAICYAFFIGTGRSVSSFQIPAPLESTYN